MNNRHKPIALSEAGIGQKIKATSIKQHFDFPDVYPKPGTIGIVKDLVKDIVDPEDENTMYLVQWPKGALEKTLFFVNGITFGLDESFVNINEFCFVNNKFNTLTQKLKNLFIRSKKK